jgi:ATP-binding cassette subfamily F protein 3
VLVSHDRYLIDALATQLWLIDAHDRSLEIYQGTYSAYRGYKEAQQVEIVEDSTDTGKISVGQKPRPGKRSKFEEKRHLARITAAESRIAELELRLVELGKQLESPPADPAEVQRLSEEYAHHEGALGKALEEWEELHL